MIYISRLLVSVLPRPIRPQVCCPSLEHAAPQLARPMQCLTMIQAKTAEHLDYLGRYSGMAASSNRGAVSLFADVVFPFCLYPTMHACLSLIESPCKGGQAREESAKQTDQRPEKYHRSSVTRQSTIIDYPLPATYRDLSRAKACACRHEGAKAATLLVTGLVFPQDPSIRPGQRADDQKNADTVLQGLCKSQSKGGRCAGPGGKLLQKATDNNTRVNLGYKVRPLRRSG